MGQGELQVFPDNVDEANTAPAKYGTRPMTSCTHTEHIRSVGARQEIDRLHEGTDRQARGTPRLRAEQPLEGMHIGLFRLVRTRMLTSFRSRAGSSRLYTCKNIPAANDTRFIQMTA